MLHDHNRLPTSTGTTLKINGKLLYAFFLSGIGVWLWPDSLVDWGWGYIAIMLWLSSLGLVIQAATLAVKQWWHDRPVAEMVNSAPKPKSAHLASDSNLKDAGMIDE